MRMDFVRHWVTVLALLVGSLLAVVVQPAKDAVAASSGGGSWTSGYVFIVADQADEQIAEAQGVPVSALAYLGFDPNAFEANSSNGYAPPVDLTIYTSGGIPVYVGLAGGANAPSGRISLQGATRQQTVQLLAGFLSSHNALASLAHYVPAGPATVNYLAMGDSYSSGESVTPPPYIYGSQLGQNSAVNGCDRSSLAAPELLKSTVQQITRASSVNLQFIACSGAKTTQMLGTDNGGKGSHGEVPQLVEEKQLETLAFGGAAPDLITMTAGGDDVGFTPVLAKCIEEHMNVFNQKDCTHDASWVRKITDGIVNNETALESAYSAIAAAAGQDTSVLVADYPQILPQAKQAQDCVQLHPYLSEQAQNQIIEWGWLLDWTVQNATVSAGLNFVPVTSAFAGHAVCDSKGAWINGITTVNGIAKDTWPFFKYPTGSFHPNKLGQKGYADAFASYINHVRAIRGPQTSKGLPADVIHVLPDVARRPTAVAQGAAPSTSPLARPQLSASSAGTSTDTTVPTDSSSLLMGDLTVVPSVSDPTSCPVLFAGGEAVHVTGDGFAPGSSITVTAMPDTPEATEQLVTADDSGQIDTTVDLPHDLSGYPTADGGALGYVEADGAGANSTDQADDALFNLGSADANCGAPDLGPSTATVSLAGSNSPYVPAAGAVFAVAGPGLPALDDASSPTPGTFAELDTAADETTVCPAAEPSGVTCVDGVLGALTPGSTYTATEITAPSGYSAAEPQTFDAPTDGTTAVLAFLDDYVGQTPSAGATVSLSTAAGSIAPAGAVFAVTGPGLPAASGSSPAPGTFAELDTGPYGFAECPAAEPPGVACDDGVLDGLTPNEIYTATEIVAPPGYASAAPQEFATPLDGSTVDIQFVDSGAAPARVTVTLASDATSSLPLEGAVFAIEGNGLPAITGTPTAGSFAELDSAADGTAVCPAVEPAGVACSGGMLSGLTGGSAYTITEVSAPAGYVPAGSQTFSAATDGSTTTVAFVNAALALPVVTWTNPAAISYGTALSAAQLDATASVPGTFTYSPAAGAVLVAGQQLLTATFTPTDAVDYASVTATVQVQVDVASPIVSWPAPAPITYGTALSGAQLNATASVPGTFTYSPAAGVVPGAGPLSLSVTFTPTDAGDYAPVTSSVTLVVNKAAPVVTWATPPQVTYGTALSTTQLNATASVPGTFVYTPAAGAVLGAGARPLSVTFTPTDGADYALVSTGVTLQVNTATPVLTWPAPAPITYGTALSPTQLDATASVPGTFTYTPAIGRVLAAGATTLLVTFTPADTADYVSTTATVGLVVNKASPALTWTTPAAITYGTALSPTQLDATASVPGTFNYTPPSGTVLAAGSRTLTVTFTPTDTSDYTASMATVTLTVNKATPTVTWAAPSAILYGTALSATQLDATASVPGTVVYTPAAGTVLTAGATTLSVTFNPTDTSDYAAATTTTTLTVNKAIPSVTWTAPATITYGTALSATQLNAHTTIAGTYAYTPATGVVLQPGTQTLTVVFTPTDTADYTSATATTSLVVGFSQACITTTKTGPFTVAAGQSICVGTGGKLTGPVNVSGGGELWVSGGSITGPLTVAATAQLWASAASVTGSLTASGATAFTICGSQIVGPVSVTGTKGAVLIGGTNCAGNVITGSVSVTANTGGVGFSNNKVTGALTITKNTGGFQYAGNTVTGTVTVTGNS